jgi:hypothetical protein
MKRRSITLGVEQVAELMQRLSKTEGLLEKLGIDFDVIPSPEEVFSTNVVNRTQKHQGKLASHGLKRQRVQELEVELMDASLPDRKRRRTEDYLLKAQERLRASTEQLEKASAVTAKTKPSKQRKYGQVSREQWKKWRLRARNRHRMVANRLFYPPPDARKHWNGVITNDGISCSWRLRAHKRHQIKHRVVPSTYPKANTKAKKKKTTATQIEIVPRSSLGPNAPQTRPKEYGTHGDTVWIEPGPLTIIAVDPGHATLVDTVRYHPDGVHVESLPFDASRSLQRRHRLQQKLASQDRTHFSLTNVHWQVLCGRRTAKDRMQHLMKKMDLQPAIDLLAQSSSRVATSVAYMEYLHARLATLDTMKRLALVRAQAPQPRHPVDGSSSATF